MKEIMRLTLDPLGLDNTIEQYNQINKMLEEKGMKSRLEIQPVAVEKRIQVIEYQAVSNLAYGESLDDFLDVLREDLKLRGITLPEGLK